MTKIKKVLSIVLCLSMLLGTLTVGLLFASADDTQSAEIPTYEDLVDDGTKTIYYAGFEAYEGTELSDGVIPSGSTVQIKFYAKSNLDLFRSTHFLVLDKSEAIASENFVTDITPSRTTLRITKVDGSSKTNQAKFYNKDNRDEVYISGYSANEIDKWGILKIYDSENVAHSIAGDDPYITFNLNLAPDFSGTFNVFMVEDSFTAANGTKKTNGIQYLGTKTSYAAVDSFVLQPAQTFTVRGEVKFLNADGTLIENQYPEKNAKIVPPEVEGLYAWADSEGNFVDLSNAYMGDESLVYTAVLKDTIVNVTLDGNGGLIDGQATRTIDVPVSQALDLTQYSASKDGDTFKGWSVNGIATEQYTFGSASPVTASAIWENSAVLKVLVAKADGTWAEFVDYVGVPGEALNQESYDAIESAVKAEFKKSGMSVIGCEEEPVYVNLQYLADIGVIYLENLDSSTFGEVVFGETPFLFINSKFVQTLNYYYPNINADGSAVADSWDKYKTVTYEFTSYLDNSNYNPDEPGNIDNLACNYKYAGTTLYDPSRVGGKDYFVKVENLEKRFETDENSKYLYTSTFKDGNGNEIVPDSGFLTLATSGYTTPGVFDLYTCPKDRTFLFSFNAKAGGGNNYQIVDKEYKVGDTLTKDDLAGCYRSDSPSTKYSVNDLTEDCTIIDRPGYKLADIWFGSDESTEDTSILKGNTVTLTKEMIDEGLTTLTFGGKKYDTVSLSSSFETKEYEFTVKYKKADGSWEVLTSKKFSGKQIVSYADLIDADLEQRINDNAPTGELLNSSGFEVESTGAVKSSFYAYEGPLTLRVQYMSDQRSAFIDYNNGKDGADAYRKGDFTYGTVIYDPNFDPDAVDEDGKPIPAPFFNNFLESDDSNVPSKTVKTQKKDSDGNLLYEPLYEVVKDEDGNPVIDPITGEPKTQIVYEEVKDENGNVKLDDDGKPVKQIVYDMDKPIYNDPKGNTPLRPYRACEYVGTKVYHVNSAIRNWSDMPAESEWLDGYENDEYRLYNTTILQLQWKSDEDFIFRVYDTSGFSIGLPIIGDGFSLNMNGNIYSALGKDFKWYYWKNNRPCKKGEGRLNADPENQIILLLWPKKEVLELGTDENGNPITSEGWYLSALPLAKTWFKPSFIPDLIPTLLPLIKGLLN